MRYRIIKQLYQKGLYDVVRRITAESTSHFKSLPFRDGQPLKIQTKNETITGQYLGTIRDGFLLSVSGHPVTIPFQDVERICVYWH